MSHAAMMIPGLDRVGGAEQQAISLAKGLRRRGWRVSMVALSGSGGSAAAELEDAGIQFLSLEMRKGLADPRGGGKGDLYYHVRVLTPTKLTRDQRKLLEQLGASLKIDNKPADRNSTIFDKVKDIFG